MKYVLQKTLHSDFKVMEKGKLPGRAYCIPYKDSRKLRGTALMTERYESDMVQLLSGDWDFRFYKKASAMPDVLDTARCKFDTVHVPSVWQRTGYLPPVYLNCPYECKTIAPEVPADMPAAVYRKKVTVSDLSKNYILTFLGVSSNLSLYVNGVFVGYSEGSHNTAEFDLTELLRAGENELLLASWKWCNGTFLEAQDMFRENGIFRDVYLTAYDKTYLFDYEVRTQKKENGYALSVDGMVKGCTDGFVLLATLEKDGKELARVTAPAAEKTVLEFGMLDVLPWSAEIPNVYELYLTLQKDGTEAMTVRNITGFKHIEIRDAVFYLNDRPIKIKGVNHHDTNPYRGYAMTPEDMLQDITIMKRFNVNAVRTSHYPPDPLFLLLATVYGLYIIDEADIETHGCWEMMHDVSFISKQLVWAPRYVDRVARMYLRDRNSPCVIMWSLGNESGGYQCHDRCFDWLKNTGTEIPVHYEGVRDTKRFHYDVISEMYTPTEEMEKMLQGKRRRRFNGVDKLCRTYNKYPFFLCEYCHAMGVGPGNMEEYWDLIYSSDSFMGGCIWEWADHTVYHAPDDPKYKYRYTYGGDHGEPQHDGHFCVDGLFYATREPNTGALAMKVCYRPVRASSVGGTVYRFENTNRFRSSGYLRINWQLLINGEPADQGSIQPDIAPMDAVCIDLGHIAFDESKDAHIVFTYLDGAETVAVEQLTLHDVPYEYDIEIGSKIRVESEYGIVTVLFENGKAVFDGASGTLTEYVVNDTPLLHTAPVAYKGLHPNIFRALIDNDTRMRMLYLNAGLDTCVPRLRDFQVRVEDGEAAVTAVYALCAKGKALYEVTMQYVLTSLGAMEIVEALRVTHDDAPLSLPRFGLLAELPADCRNVRYYGRGPAENMPDFKAQAPVGIYADRAENMIEPYVYPQDSGNHGDVKWLELTNDAGKGIRLCADDRFSFSVHPFTQEALHKAEHREDLCDMGTTVLSVDGYVRGIGSSSCGPDTRIEYQRSVDEGLELRFTILPIV